MTALMRAQTKALSSGLIISKMSSVNSTWIPYNLLPGSCGGIDFREHRSNIGLKIRPQSVLTASQAPACSKRFCSVI
jgi:hypothetical protein